MVTLLITLIQNPKPSKFTLGMVIHPKLMPFLKCLLLGAITQKRSKDTNHCFLFLDMVQGPMVIPWPLMKF